MPAFQLRTPCLGERSSRQTRLVSLGLLPALAFLFMWLGFGAWGWVKRMGGGLCCEPSVKGYTAREKVLPKLASYVTTGLFLGAALGPLWRPRA